MSHVTVECDGVDYTKRLADYGAHSVLVLNIPSYSGGTKPWNSKSKGKQEVRCSAHYSWVYGHQAHHWSYRSNT